MNEIIQFGSLELRFLQSGQDTDAGLDLFEMLLPPGGRMPVPHYHESWDEAVYGLSGVLNFEIGDEDIAIGPGQSAFIQRGVVHGFKNKTQAPATCLSVLTPGVLGPQYFRELAVMISSGAPLDPGRVKEVMLRYGLIPVAPKA